MLDWLDENARCFGDRPALLGIDRPPASHAQLYRQVRDTAQRLNALGLGRGDLICLRLANSPETLVLILAAAAAAVAFPNPPEEPLDLLESVLARAPAKALLFAADRPGPHPELCRRLGLLALGVRVEASERAGCFRLEVPKAANVVMGEPPHLDDAAVLARTAGTTSLPRLIAWSQASLYRSSDTAAGWMGLDGSDRSLCVMPFGSLHSLVRSCLPVLLRGGSVICAPGFDKVHVLNWIRDLRPSFMTAVPAVFRATLAHAGEMGREARGTSLRFLAAGSDRLGSETAEEMSRAFDVPVREFYGMNEVAPMLAGTEPGRLAQQDGVLGPPLPPWTLEIRDTAGSALPAGQEGEIAARGGLFNPVVSEVDGRSGRVIDGWYLTGDLGVMDARGRLRLTGRADDRINRGGKKVSPAAVESALMDHSGVSEAVVFPVPDAVLGQRVAAMVVPKSGQHVDETRLRVHLAERLPDFMVPEWIQLTNETPRTAVGKISRRMLAESFGSIRCPGAGTQRCRVFPATPTEAMVNELMAEVLGRTGLDLEAGFFDLGGDSFLAVSLLVSIEDRFGATLTPADFMAGASVAALARLIDERKGWDDLECLYRVSDAADGPTLILTHAPMGYAYYAHAFARHLGAGIGVVACRWRDARTDPGEPYTMERHASQYVAEILKLDPRGPYCIAGHSFGAHLAYEIAVQLTAAGRTVAFLGLMDDEADLFKRRFAVRRQGAPSSRGFRRSQHLLQTYVPPIYPGHAELFLAETLVPESLADPLVGWGDLVESGVTRHVVPGDHVTMMSDATIARWSGLLRERLNAAWEAAASNQPLQSIRSDPGPGALARQASMKARRAGVEGDLDREIAEYARAIELDPHQPYWVFRNLGCALLQRGDTEAGLDRLREAIGREAVPIPGYGVLVAALRGLGRDSQAVDALESLRHDIPDLPHAHLALGQIFATSGLHDDALDRLGRVVALQPNHAKAQLDLAKVLARLGRYREAIPPIESALAERPQNPNYRHQHGLLLLALGDNPGAESAFRKAIAYDPEYFPSHMSLADLLEGSGQIDDAKEILARAIRLRGNLPGPWIRLARILETQGDSLGAESARRRARELSAGQGAKANAPVWA